MVSENMPVLSFVVECRFGIKPDSELDSNHILASHHVKECGREGDGSGEDTKTKRVGQSACKTDKAWAAEQDSAETNTIASQRGELVICQATTYLVNESTAVMVVSRICSTRRTRLPE